LQETPGVEEELDEGRVRKDGEPGDDGVRHEIRIYRERLIGGLRRDLDMRFGREAEPRVQCVPGQSLRTRSFPASSPISFRGSASERTARQAPPAAFSPPGDESYCESSR
jgi:hypothetical protein